MSTISRPKFSTAQWPHITPPGSANVSKRCAHMLGPRGGQKSIGTYRYFEVGKGYKISRSGFGGFVRFLKAFRDSSKCFPLIDMACLPCGRGTRLIEPLLVHLLNLNSVQRGCARARHISAPHYAPSYIRKARLVGQIGLVAHEA